MSGVAPATITLAQAMQMAVAHHQAGRLAQAEALYQQILKVEPNHPEALNFLGVLAHQVGKHEIAVELIGRAVTVRPDYAEAHYNLGKVLQAQGRLIDAVACYHKALSIRPDYAEVHNNLGNVQQAQGKPIDAVASYRTAIACKPDYAAAYNNLGGMLADQGQLDEAVASFHQALVVRPDYADAHYNLGKAYQKQSALDEAVVSYGKALAINPNHVDTHNNLGNALRGLGKLDAAIESLRTALKLKPDYAEAYNNLGNALKDQDKLGEAAECYRKALALMPDYADALNNLGNVLIDQGILDEAIACFHQALALKTDFAEAHYNLGIALQAQGKFEAAANSYRQALALKPDYAEAYSNLGNVLGFQGELNEAIECCHKALSCKPVCIEAHSNLIFLQDASAGIAVSTMQAERRRWGEIHAAHLLSPHLHPNQPDPERRLRIGYVSADLRNHSAAKVFGAMLTRFDAAQFEVYAYSNSRKVDSDTQRFQQHVSCWREIAGVADEAVADLIRQDGIDILVDLSGHSAGNRLLVFARKPAPIQITAWGYIGGTGMKAMDVFFADPVIVPPEEKPLYAEQVRYLPNVVSYCYQPPIPAVNALSVLSAKGITFGSFNRLVKISDETYRVWAQVLRDNPDSNIILKTVGLDDPNTRERVTSHFTAAGISPERVILLGGTSWHEHMAAFNQVDISLDPFPHGGGVSALEGLMMGVPVVTLRCPTLAGRLSASILTTLKLTDWIAETPEQYIEIAGRKARDIAALAELRRQLRNRLSASIIGDADAYVRAVEGEYRQLWKEWCGRQDEIMSVGS